MTVDVDYYTGATRLTTAYASEQEGALTYATRRGLQGRREPASRPHRITSPNQRWADTLQYGSDGKGNRMAIRRVPICKACQLD